LQAAARRLADRITRRGMLHSDAPSALYARAESIIPLDRISYRNCVRASLHAAFAVVDSL
jgi:hypothetical protein